MPGFLSPRMPVDAPSGGTILWRNPGNLDPDLLCVREARAGRDADNRL